MKAIVLTGHGGMEMLEYREDFPCPLPGEGEVLIEVHACGMNNTDVWVREGAYGTQEDPSAVSTWRRGQSTLTFPRIQGADTVGKIVEVGKGANKSLINKRVMVDFSIYNSNTDSLADIDYIGHGRDGGYAEYCVVPVENAHIIDTDMSDAELATFCCAYLTAEHMLNRAHVAKNERVLITGASGGVGSALIQLCRIRGAIPFAIAGAGKESAVKNIGAEAVITRQTDNLSDAVNIATNSQSIDVIADLAAGPMFRDLLNILRPEGRYITAGAIAGPVVELDLRTMYLKHLELHGSSQGTRKEFRDLVTYIENGKLKALLHATYPLSEFHKAQTDFINKNFIGKLVAMPDRFFEPV